MFTKSKDTLLGIPYARIQKLMFGVLNATYDARGVVKLTEDDKCEVVSHLICYLVENQSRFVPGNYEATTWMCKLAKNEFLHYLYYERKHIVDHYSIESNRDIADKVMDIEDVFTYYTEEELDALDAEISLLKEQDKHLIELYCHRVSEKDIAKLLNINYNNVRQKIRRIKIDLAERVRHRLL